MSYIKTLFKFGGFNIPLKYIKMDTYEIAPNQRQDLDSYTDANGLTHRNALSHTKTQVKFTTRQLPESDFYEMMHGIQSNYKSDKERDANCEYFDPEYNKIKTGHFYLDPSLKIKFINMFNDGRWENGQLIEAGTIRLVGEVEWTFIEY